MTRHEIRLRAIGVYGDRWLANLARESMIPRPTLKAVFQGKRYLSSRRLIKVARLLSLELDQALCLATPNSQLLINHLDLAPKFSNLIEVSP